MTTVSFFQKTCNPVNLVNPVKKLLYVVKNQLILLITTLWAIKAVLAFDFYAVRAKVDKQTDI